MTGSVRPALLRRDYDAPIDDVWDACTDRDRLSRWFLPVSGNCDLAADAWAAIVEASGSPAVQS